MRIKITYLKGAELNNKEQIKTAHAAATLKLAAAAAASAAAHLGFRDRLGFKALIHSRV